VMDTIRISTRSLALPLAIALACGAAIPALAQDEAQSATVAQVNAGQVTGTVTMDGAALYQVDGDEDEYVFSDGTDVIELDMNTSNADPELPLLTLLNIVGTVASDEIDVISWAPLDLMVPAVIRTPEEAMEAYWGWIVTQNAQEGLEPAE
jgi:uncharacterized protein YdeI (BOF family)